MKQVIASLARQLATAGPWPRPPRRHMPCRVYSALSQPDGQADRAATFLAAGPQATQLLAFYLASDLEPGDCYLLYGSVGAGKSFFRWGRCRYCVWHCVRWGSIAQPGQPVSSRAVPPSLCSRTFIRAAAGDEALAVPSPTFLLQNVYDDHAGPAIHHFDLYRLDTPQALQRLDLAASFARAVSLVEWPERLAGEAPAANLQLRISILSQAEQRRLEQQHGAAARQEDAGQEEWDYSEDGDLRWRRIALQARGRRWERRLAQLEEQVRLCGAEYGCWLSPDPTLAEE